MTNHDDGDDSPDGIADADPNDGYQVGYGRPPRQHRFKPGNQAARKTKRAKARDASLTEALDRALKSRVKVKHGDKIVSIGVDEVLSTRLVQAMTRGSTRDMIAVFNLFQQHAPHLLAVDAEPFRVEYYRAEGSTVELPSSDLYDEDKSS